MKPWEQAANWYARYEPNTDFGAAMVEAIKGGLLYSHDDLFVMGRETRWDGEQIIEGEPNAWYITMAAARGGNAILRVMDLAPYPHEWCLWRRRNDGRIRAHKWQDLIMKLQGGQ